MKVPDEFKKFKEFKEFKESIKGVDGVDGFEKELFLTNKINNIIFDAIDYIDPRDASFILLTVIFNVAGKSKKPDELIDFIISVIEENRNLLDEEYEGKNDD